MGVGFNGREPTNTTRFYQNIRVVNIFREVDGCSILRRFYDYDDEATLEFSSTFRTIGGRVCGCNEKKYRSTTTKYWKDFKVDIVRHEIINQKLLFTFLGLDIIIISSS